MFNLCVTSHKIINLLVRMIDTPSNGAILPVFQKKWINYSGVDMHKNRRDPKDPVIVSFKVLKYYLLPLMSKLSKSIQKL